ncbi:MAG TPA: hypothetical protein VMW85_07130 [Methanomassiliicoccales archaeon]|nr:hypothetical protein [Methanomassiliicoccales archaeon]
MKILVVYDSVSPAKLTARVADTIAGAMKEKGMEIISVPIEDVKHINVEEYDCLVIGSPTMAWKPTKATLSFLNGLAGKTYSGKYAAAFDTQVQLIISGNATKTMEAKLKKLGFGLASPPLMAYVVDKKDGYQMKEGELERAQRWAQELTLSLSMKG